MYFLLYLNSIPPLTVTKIQIDPASVSCGDGVLQQWVLNLNLFLFSSGEHLSDCILKVSIFLPCFFVCNVVVLIFLIQS